jgi:hypothetical protein
VECGSYWMWVGSEGGWHVGVRDVRWGGEGSGLVGGVIGYFDDMFL